MEARCRLDGGCMEAGWRLDVGWMEAAWRLDGGGWMEGEDDIPSSPAPLYHMMSGRIGVSARSLSGRGRPFVVSCELPVGWARRLYSVVGDTFEVSMVPRCIC